MATSKIRVSGPLFDGQAGDAVREYLAAVTTEIAEIGRDWIRLEAGGGRMDKSGRGGTGAAAGGVTLSARDGAQVIAGGISEGEYAWPWLEGTSRRNTTTGFKGYHTFRRTRLRLRKQAAPYAQERLAAFLPRMGGE
jgi:hypothetical protein